MKRDQFLLTSSIVQFALFLPLAWWASKYQVPPADVAITHLLQRKQSSCSRVGVKVLNTLTGSAVFMNVLVVPIAALLWRMHLRIEAIMMVVTCWMGGLVRSAIKQMVNRPRPNPLLVHVGTQTKGKSFPSGHVASSVCVWLGVRPRTPREEEGTTGEKRALGEYGDVCRIHWSGSCVPGRSLDYRCSGWLPFWWWMAESLAVPLSPMARRERCHNVWNTLELKHHVS